ncbi:MAG: hypothetical protein ACPL1Y_05000 [Thermoplasmata archaeon]
MPGKPAKKVQDVSFNVIFSTFEPVLSIFHREGELFLSYSSILISDAASENWVEVPFKEISSIDVEDVEKEPKLNFRFSDGTLEVKGKDSASVLALRHFLLPLISHP